MEKIYDTVIIGSGPAGLTAAIYAQRAGIDFLVLEKNALSGGQMVYTNEVENYPAIEQISGFELGLKMRKQAEKLGAGFVQTEVKSLMRINDFEWKIITSAGEYRSKTIIYAGGAEHKMLGVPGEAELKGRGVSYCATCDGGFYKGRTTAVIGGGNTALQDALYLAKFCQKVYLVHRRDEFRAFRNNVAKVRSAGNIEMILKSQLIKINGNKKVCGIVVADHGGTERQIDVDGVFMAVGIRALNELVTDFVKLDAGGFIITDESCWSGTPGLFIAGDVRSKKYRQIITAAADGAIAAESVNEYIISN